MQNGQRWLWWVMAAAIAGGGIWSATAHAQDVGVIGSSLAITVNTFSGKHRLKSAQKDPLIKTGGTGALSGQLEVYYADAPSNAGALPLPSPWTSNDGVTAKFRNNLAPAGPTPVRIAVVKVGRLGLVSAKGIGHLSLATPPGPNGIVTVLTVHNAKDGSTHRMCSRYSASGNSYLRYESSLTGYAVRGKRGVPTACPPAPTCSDGIQNGGETGVDCGGVCSGCPSGGGCNTGADCASGVCTAGVCQPAHASCTDNTKNGSETGVDCGGGTCPKCGAGQGCQTDADCVSSVCGAFVCQPVGDCADGTKDGTETDVDCGGTCGACDVGGNCSVDSDCATGFCDGGTCKCPAVLYTFDVTSSDPGLLLGGDWPGGTQTQSAAPGCSVTIHNPAEDVALACLVSGPFRVDGSTGYSSCAGAGGEDGDGCNVTSCPLLGIGFCCDARPSCTVSIGGAATAQYYVQCNP